MPRHLFFIPVCYLKVLVLTVVCILSSCNLFIATWSAFSLPGITVWAGIKLIVGLCVNLDNNNKNNCLKSNIQCIEIRVQWTVHPEDAASLMALVIVLKSSFLLFSMFTAVKEYVFIAIVSLVSLAFSSATRMAVISASSTDAESLSLITISPSLCTTAAATRVPPLEPSV